MGYQGGKDRSGKAIAAVLAPALHVGTGHYVEPFMGECGVARHVARSALSMSLSDASEDLVLLWQGLQSGWAPPGSISEVEYAAQRVALPSALRGFVGYGCSFGGKWFGGYARDRAGSRDLVDESARRLASKTADLARCPRVGIRHADYRDVDTCLGDVVYCDPPYAGTLGYRAVGEFDHAEFWQTMESWHAKHAFVFVSEFAAPAGWVPVWQGQRGWSTAVAGTKAMARGVDQLFCKPVVAEILGLKVCDDGPR